MTKRTLAPRHAMPREKLMEKGPENLKDAELLAILLGTGTKEKNVLELSRAILYKHPTTHLLSLTHKDLSQINGIGPAKACIFLAAFELTKRALDVADNNLPTITRACDAVAQLQELRTVKKEHFVALYLNARNQLVHKETISIGTLNASLIHPREIFKPAIDHLAASIIVAHNHPSGDTEPSHDDLMVTKRITEAGKIMGVDLIDHIIITKDGYYSLQEKNML